MSNTHEVPEFLKAIIEGIVLAKIGKSPFDSLGMVELDPTKDIGEQIDAAIKKAKDEHEKNCPRCRAKRQAKAAEEVAEAKDSMAQERAEQRVKSNAPEADRQADRDRVLVGYMAFIQHGEIGSRPIHDSFHPEKEPVEAGLKKFLNDPTVELMNAVGLKVRGDVRAVYAE